MRLLILTLFVLGCAGTLGSFSSTTLPISKQELHKRIEDLYRGHPDFKVPGKWTQFDDWGERGYNFLDGRVFHLSDPEEELYYVTIRELNHDAVEVAVRAVHNGSGQWRKADDLSRKECERIERRFEAEILSRLER